nr:hypothetical protein [uncultured Desulfobacter sp.]
MKFESLEINQCLNKECNQKFTLDNIKLAVCLYGVIFLSEKVVAMENETPGAYIGITCPRCLSTTFWHCSKQSLFSFKAELDSELQIMKLEQTDTGKTIVEPVCSFEPQLRYYSPFNLDQKALGQRTVFYKGFSSPESSPYFYNELQDYTATELFDQEKLFCSYLAEDTPPMGSFSNVFWFREKDIPELLAIENEKHLRIFPRYIYRTELVTKIDHLLAYHYINGKRVDQAIADHKISTTDAREKLKDYARENNINFENLAESNGLMEPDVFINEVQETLERMKIDPLIPAQFLDILTAKPSHLGEPWYQRHCDYLWASVNPFENKAFPEFFVDEIDDPDLGDKIHDKNEKHITMAKLVQENSTTQYVQDFLKTNIIYFLEEYEGTLQSNEFSYAHVWQLKEFYLEELYKEILKGLSEQAPYVMKKEGKAWKIVFNGNPMSSLRRIGFAYLYHLICNPNEYFFHADLFIAAGKGLPVSSAKDNVEFVDAKGEPIATRMIDDEGLQNLFNRIKKLKNELDDAIDFKREEDGMQLNKEFEQTKKYLNQVYDKKKKRIRYLKDANAKKVTDSVGKAIKRALEDIQEENPDAYQHFSKAIGINNLYQDSLMYRPAPEDKIDWITIG